MPTQTRINSIDLLRGIVMIIMALDHTRDFFHAQAFTDDPLNLQTTTPMLYFTRWITHLCAPTFVFLSGTSAYLQGLRKSKAELSAFLLKRGLWLILVEILIMTFGLTFDIHYNLIILQVIWAIGISMVVLSAAVWLPFYAILIVGIAIVAGHNILDTYEAGHVGQYPIWYSLLRVQNMYPIGRQTLMIFYPFLPWTGVMLLGYCFGRYYLKDVTNRNKRAIVLGASVLFFSIIVRWTNAYGDPFEWSIQKSSLYTFFSFIKVHKYPPSLLFISMTLGLSLILLGVIGNARNRLANAITVYGRVPLFYYVIHFYLLHILSAIMFLSRGHSFQEGVEGSPGVPFKFMSPNEGYNLEIVYLVWLGVVLALYPLCKWFSDYKLNHRQWWVSYL